MAVKLAAGVKLVEEGHTGEPALRLVVLNETTTNGWVEHLHIELEPAEAEALAYSLILKAQRLRNIRSRAET